MDEAARGYLEAVRWPGGPQCPHCRNADPARIYEIAANPEKKVRAGLRECKECGKQFTVTIGTIFEGSKIPLRQWLVAWYMLCSSKKGVSALQMQRMLGIGSYRTAWFMMRRIRFALRDPVFANKLGRSGEYMDQHLDGFDFRYNHREIADDARTREGLKKVRGKRLTLQHPAAQF